MTVMSPEARVLPGGVVPATPPRSQLETAYQHFRLERQGNLVSENTLQAYDDQVLPFLAWITGSGVRHFRDLDLATMRTYRAELATRIGKHGRRLRPHSVFDSHRAGNDLPALGEARGLR
jgi:site-specific recombinase XerC